MPNMKIGVNLLTGEKRTLTLWKSEDDPAGGRFSFGLEHETVPQGFGYNGSRRAWRTGQWNGQTFLGVPTMDSNYLNGFMLGIDKQGMLYLKYDYTDKSFITMYVVDWTGEGKQLVLVNATKDWYVEWSNPSSQCDSYGFCGYYGSCNPSNSPICKCLRGFVPKSPREWSQENWSGGCVRRTELQCERLGTSSSENGGTDGLWRLGGVKLPDFSNLLDANSPEGCQSECLNNCFCVACAYTSGIGCMIWTDGLIDIEEFSLGGLDLFIRLAKSELGERRKVPLFVIIISVIIGTAALLGFNYLLWKWTFKKKGERRKIQGLVLLENRAEQLKFLSDADRMNQMESFELQLLDFSAISLATNSFNFANKVGEGGYGPVYKGELPATKQVVAVKRLSKRSEQGLEEFKNEVLLISKLQHRNLVGLLGCCIEGDEKILVYEYMPNKSLDSFLFDPAKLVALDWAKRFHIIQGIAQGLLYLHQDSRLRIIHRDLKASNILLDGEMNPKISDFGVAKIFSGDQSLAKTKRVAGTYGYMAPEYAMEGRFSEKSDVFSFGVLLLEIVSSKKNSSFYYHEHYVNRLGYAWKLGKEGNILELLDPSIRDACSTTEVLRCVHVGLLCVQESDKESPTIPFVVAMLGDSTSFPAPNQPAFYLGRSQGENSLYRNQVCSVNEVTTTEIDGR